MTGRRTGRPTGRPPGLYEVASLGMIHPPAEEIAWAAGLFEGEGSVFRTKWGGVKVQMGMTDLDVLQHLKAVLGGVVNGPYQYEAKDGIQRKPQWRWSSTGPNAVRICRLLRPWMGERRRGRMDELCVLADEESLPIAQTAGGL